MYGILFTRILGILTDTPHTRVNKLHRIALTRWKYDGDDGRGIFFSNILHYNKRGYSVKCNSSEEAKARRKCARVRKNNS